MLITSRMVRGHCPICGAAHCKCGGPSKVIPVDQRMEVGTLGGQLKRYEIRPGVYVQLTDQAARARGLLPPEPETKKRAPVANKKRRPAANKAG